MPINRSIEDLPRATPEGGRPPSKNPWLAQAVAEKWAELNPDEQLDHALPDAGPWRASYAAVRCDRALWYRMRGIEAANPPGLAAIWRMNQGTLVHDSIQGIIHDIWPDAEVELIVDLNPAGIPGSAHADIVIKHNGKRIVVEMKTVGGFQFKSASFPFKGVTKGPKEYHIIQPAVINAALGADGVIVLYIAQENVSAQVARSNQLDEVGKFAAEWHYSTEELKPVVEAEAARAERIILQAGSDTPPRRLLETSEAPTGAVITDPSTGGYVVTDQSGRGIIDTGQYWFCGYCDHRDQCIEDGA